MMPHHPFSERPRARRARRKGLVAALALAAAGMGLNSASAQTLTDPNLQATTVVSGLTQPTCMAFLGPNDFLINEKTTGRVKRVTNGVVVATVLDLPVNSNSERGLLGIALDPQFASNGKYYLYWTESSTGADSAVVQEVGNPASAYPPGTPQPLGNRVDCFKLNADNTSTYQYNLIRLHAFQHDNNSPATQNTPLAAGAYQGNHNGGQLRVGPDGKIYCLIGDNGRRGWMQNLPNGPFLTAPFIDDEFGGPAPDNNHLTGVTLRLNTDGSTPSDNPFFAAGAAFGGEVGANIQKVFSYGHRNAFGIAFDPISGILWDCENGDDSFDEINKIVAGGNYGWVQFAGPASRIAQFKAIELALFTPNTPTQPTNSFGVGINQQIRYPVTRTANNAATGLSRLLALPGSSYQDPEMSWRYAVPPSGIGFVPGNALGPQYAGTMWTGEARTTTVTGVGRPTASGSGGTNFTNGVLMCFKLTADRQHLDLSADPRLADRVADNGTVYPPAFGTPAGTVGLKFDGFESESLLIGQGFGIIVDIVSGPDGALYAVSNSSGNVYRIAAKPIP